MRLPKSIKIGGYNYTVIPGELDCGDEGMCNKSGLKIHIDDTLPDDRLANATIHECLHALWELFDLDDKGDEEVIVTALATGIQMLFKDNPKLKEIL